MRITVLILLLLLGCGGCEQKKNPPAASPPPQPLLQAPTLLQGPTDPHLVELPTAALPLWRKHREVKPALVLFAFDPFLDPLPEELKEPALALARSGSAQEIAAHGAFYRPEPLLLPKQVLSAALEGGLVSRFYWVFPSKIEPNQLTLDTFREQMTKARFLTDAEATALTLVDGVYTGTVRGIPFAAVHPTRLAAIQGPLLLHIDLSYFQGLYDNEIKTPLYDLLHATAGALRQTGWTPLSLSLSYSTLEGAISIDTRFLLTDLAELLRRPALLDAAIPETWNRRAEALYAADMYTESKKIELYRANAAAAPEDATVVYDLFQGHFLAKEIAPALEALDRAVALDPGYAAAYIDLAQIALGDGNLSVALELLGKAALAFPENPFIDLQRAGLLIETGDQPKALEIVEKLKQQAWSPLYHARVPEILVELEKGARAAAGPRKKR